jgi:trimeric autotransporter adhesin
MMRWATWLVAAIATISIASCASNTPASGSNDVKNATNARIAQAQSMSTRASASYSAGDLNAALAGFEGATLIYESLAMAEPQAQARLSAARVMAESSAIAAGLQAALALVQKVLADSADLSMETRITAQGRAAALYMQLHASGAADQLSLASASLQSALVACNTTCSQASALLVLRARLELAQGNGAASVASSSQALAAAQDNASRANALRARAQAQALMAAHTQVIADAQEALALDRAAGFASRVQLDLQLLAAAHQALGQTEQAQRYAQLAARSGQAQQRMERGLP